MPSVAVVGASADRNKFSNKAIRAYRKRGWTVYPVNPKEQQIEGLPVYAALADVPRPVDRIALYLPPAVGVGILDQIAAVRAGEFYVNPGAESPELVAKAKALGLDPLLACAIVAIGESAGSY